MTLPPKPAPRPDKVSLWRYLRLFRQDILSAQPARLYRAWMAEFRTPFFPSFLVNDPKVIATVLKERPDDFPKSDRIGAGLRPVLGESVFLTNGETWKRQRRIIDPAFEGGRLRETFPAMLAAAEAAAARLAAREGAVEIEADALEIPENFVVSVEEAQIGTQITAADLDLPSGVTLVSDGEMLLVNVVEAPSEEDLEADGEGTEPISEEGEAETQEEAESSDEDSSDES